VPQDDELRSFFTARYKVLRPLIVEDAKANFRFLDISTTQQSLRYKNFAYTNGAGNTITNPIDFNLTPFCVKGVEIPSENSFATLFGEPKGSNGIMIRKFESNSGVKPAFTIQQKSHLAEPVDTTVNEHKVYTPDYHKGDIRFSLVPSVDRLVLKPGDEISISGFWLPYGESNGAKTPAREIIAFGKESPQVIAVKKGYVLNNLPTTIQVENNEAWFTLKGGLNVIPVIARGFRNYQYPALYEKIGDKWEFIHLGQTGPFDGLQLFCDKDGTYGAVFLVRTNGQAREFRIKSNESFPDIKKLSILPKTSARAEVLINNPFEKLPVILKIDNQIFPGPVTWNESEGKSFWFTGSVKDTISGARVTGFEDHVTIQYWWENHKTDHMIRSPKFELEIGANLFGGKFKSYYYSNGRLTACVDLKKAITIETDELGLGLRPAVIVLYNTELNYCIALSFKNGSFLFVKKNSFGVVMSPQNCPKIRRKVMEGNVYFMPGGPSELQRVIEQELPVWHHVIKN
jgi:hypothetical protein